MNLDSLFYIFLKKKYKSTLALCFAYDFSKNEFSQGFAEDFAPLFLKVDE